MRDFKCEIICVGSEILLGDIVNTNSHFITKSLAQIGVDVYYHTVVGDNLQRLVNAFNDSVNRGMNLIITTGGLGPTDDDITHEGTCKYFNRESVFNEEWVSHMESILSCRRENLTEANLKQGYVPKDCLVLPNPIGTAPGVIFEENGVLVINLPGPPNELYKMFNDYVIPYLSKDNKFKYYSEFLRLYGIDEGNINHILSDLFSSSDPTLAPYVGEDDLVLRITTKGINDDQAREKIREFKDEVYKRVGKFIYSNGDESIEELLFNELRKRNFKISFSESLTGGMVASRFVNLSGASEFFEESFVTYSNESKILNLGVSKETLDEFGAVSYQTAKEMSLGVLKRTSCDVSISTTGVAGPNKSEGKPVGLVYIGVSVLDKTYVKELHLIGDRMRIRKRATFEALAYCYEILRGL